MEMGSVNLQGYTFFRHSVDDNDHYIKKNHSELVTALKPVNTGIQLQRWEPGGEYTKQITLKNVQVQKHRKSITSGYISEYRFMYQYLSSKIVGNLVI